MIERATAEGERQEPLDRQARSATFNVNALAQELRDDLLNPQSRLVRKVACRTQVEGMALALPEELLGELQSVSAALKTAIDARAQVYLSRSHAAAQGQAEGRNAGEVLRITNALMRARVRGNPALRKAWEQVNRMRCGSSGAANQGSDS